MKKKLVIIGAGMASGRFLEHLFESAPDTYDVTLFNAEARGTYNRLMLSPVLAGEIDYPEIMTHGDDWYAKHGVTCRFGEKVTGIDTGAKIVAGEQGDVPYDELVIATGSDPFILPMPGHDLPGVISYRDVEDTDRMIALAGKDDARAVVIGGGLLGLEAAAGMARRGIKVTVVHIATHLMERQLDEVAGGLLADALRARGIEVLCQAVSKEILADEDGQARALLLDDGRELPLDLLVMAVGIRPSIGLAKSAGLDTNRGVVVNDHMRCSVPGVHALGECVEHDGQVFGLVAPLYDQAKVLADDLAGKSSCFVNKEVATKLKVTGCDLFSAGDFLDGEGREIVTYLDAQTARYKRFVIEGDMLIGAVMYGDTDHSAWVFNLIQNKCDISSLRSTLAFGPAFGEPDVDAPAPEEMPAPAVVSEIAQDTRIGLSA